MLSREKLNPCRLVIMTIKRSRELSRRFKKLLMSCCWNNTRILNFWLNRLMSKLKKFWLKGLQKLWSTGTRNFLSIPTLKSCERKIRWLRISPSTKFKFVTKGSSSNRLSKTQEHTGCPCFTRKSTLFLARENWLLTVIILILTKNQLSKIFPKY